MSEVFSHEELVESVKDMWGLEYQPMGCSRCGYTFLADAAHFGKPCPVCGEGTLTVQSAFLRKESPEMVLPLRQYKANLPALLGDFVKELVLAPPGFNLEVLTQRATLVYFPMWLVDSNVNGSWRAQMGFDYQVKSSQEQFQNNSWHTREIVKNRIRWEERLGEIKRRYQNLVVPALREHAHLLKLVGGYRFEPAVAYKSEQIQGALVRIPDLQQSESWPLAQAELNRLAGQDCLLASGAQHIQHIAWQTSFEEQNWTQILLPLYCSFYKDDQGKIHPVWINGQTGTVGGVRIASQRKGWQVAGLFASAAIVVFLLAALCFLFGAAFPPVMVLGGVFAILAFLGVGTAIIPAVWPWLWNRRELSKD